MSDVRKPAHFQDMMTKFKSEGLFETFKDCLVFAACIGYSEGVRVSFDKSAEPIAISVFRGEYDEAVIHAIALCETDDPAVMGDAREAERIRIFEEYACGGLAVLEKLVASTPDEYREALLNLVAGRNEKTKTGIIDDIKSTFA